MSILSTIDLEEEISELEKELFEAEKELKLAPKGNLTIERCNGRIRYYNCECKQGKFVRHGITRNKSELCKLARKAYLQNEIRILKKDLTALNSIKNRFTSPGANSILQSLHSRFDGIDQELFFKRIVNDGNCNREYREYINGKNSIKNQSKSLKQWELCDYEKSNHYVEGLKFVTQNGIYVRSKSELIIAQKLIEHKIPFHYEEILYLADGRVYAPDFTVRRYDGKIFYWEHFGMMKNTDYRDDYNKKMRNYSENGIGPWDNLIATYDSLDGNININEIEWIIENKLIVQA